MTMQPNNPRDWVFRINERQQVTFGELAQILGGYGFAITDVVTNERVQKTFVIRDEDEDKPLALDGFTFGHVAQALQKLVDRIKALEKVFANHPVNPRHIEMLEKKIEANGKRIGERLRLLERADSEAEDRVHALNKQLEIFRKQVAELETVRASKSGEDGTGIKVVIHDFPTHGDGSFRLQDVGSALKKLRPTRVLVDMAGANRIPAEALRKDWDMPVEPLPKRAKPTPLPPPDCPQHDTRCRPGNCVWERASVSSPAETFARRP